MIEIDTNQSLLGNLSMVITDFIRGMGLVFISFIFLIIVFISSCNNNKAITEASETATYVEYDSVDTNKNGKAILLTGPVTCTSSITDPLFNITSDSTITISREVELYQWIEKEKLKPKDSAGSIVFDTTHIYVKTWSAKTIRHSFDSTDQYINPPFPVESQRFTVDNIHIGSYTVHKDLLQMLSTNKPIALDESYQIQSYKGVKPIVENNYLYFCKRSHMPEIGNIRVRFSKVAIREATILASQEDGIIVPFKGKKWGEVYLISKGGKTLENMASLGYIINFKVTLVLSFLGFLFMRLGFNDIFKPIYIVATFFRPNWIQFLLWIDKLVATIFMLLFYTVAILFGN